MMSEIDLQHTWYPLINTTHPPNIHSQSADYVSYDERTDVRFMSYEQGVLEAHRFFLPQGIMVVRTQWVLDPDDDRLTSLPRLKGYKDKAEYDLHSLVVVFGAGKSVCITTQENGPKSVPPAWIAEKFVWWILPYMARRMVSIGAGIFEHPDYGIRMKEDRHGLYARVQHMYELGKQREQTLLKTFSTGTAATMPSTADLGLAGLLGERIRQLEDPAHASGPVATDTLGGCQNGLALAASFVEAAADQEVETEGCIHERSHDSKITISL